MYLGYQNEKIKFYTEEPLDKELYNLDKVEETQEEYALDGEEYVLKDEEYEEKQAEKARQARINEIKAELDALDLKTIRPLRANEADRLSELEAQAQALRDELKELSEALKGVKDGN